MGRDIFETEADKQNEEKVARAVGVAWKCKLVKLPDKHYALDRVAVRGPDRDVFAWCEIKVITKANVTK